ncbi:MAG TPA: DNA primase, partial [Dehalococcoidia bacterium]|nr:DNA primase [Dehalococcoidia bacterium]
PGEPLRVQPSRARAQPSGGQVSNLTAERSGEGRRQPKHPLITVAKAEHKDEALAGLERWKARHPEAATRLKVDDILVDAMRGRFTTWTRIRVNLRHVPEKERPSEEAADPDYDPWAGITPGA